MLLKAAKCQGVIVFTVSELLRENQQDGGGKIRITFKAYMVI